MQALTNGQRRALEAILRFTEKEERPPSMRELAATLGCHVKTVWQYLSVLERKGYLVRNKGRIRLAPGLARGRAIPVVGRVAAGSPILAVENREGALSLEDLFGVEEGLFAVRAEGDSMVDAGILDGDWLIVRSASRVESGGIAVCYLGKEGDVTVKRLLDRCHCYELAPANKAYQPIRVHKDDPHFRVAGKVVGIVRRMR
jgi:repressor LexA